jgi:beta-galactosidase/beta-glucuronidase
LDKLLEKHNVEDQDWFEDSGHHRDLMIHWRSTQLVSRLARILSTGFEDIQQDAEIERGFQEAQDGWV